MELDVNLIHSGESIHLFDRFKLIIPSSSAPLPQIDIIRAVVIVWRARGKIIRSVLCSIMCNNCTQ